MDMYNALSDGTSDSRWQQYLNRPYGLLWLSTFAKDHHKPIALPEWGTGFNAKGEGGGDDPEFIRHMGEWIAANNVAFHGYWNYQAKDFKASLTVGQYPKSEEAFRETFVKTPADKKTDGN